jgi:signal transduction histidine kinase
LVTNAIRPGEGRIRVGIAHAGGDLRLDVHDHGGGRPIRGHPSTDDEAGRGLALIDALMDAQGGECWVTEDASGPGKTVCVRICLPAEDTGATGLPEDESLAGLVNPAGQAGRGAS